MLVPHLFCKKSLQWNSDCFGGGSWPSQYFLCHVIHPEESKVLTDKRASDHRGTPRNFPRIQITHTILVDPELHHTNYEHLTPIFEHPSQLHPSNAVGVCWTVKSFPNSNCLSAHTLHYTCYVCTRTHTHTHTHTLTHHTVVHKMHTVVHYTQWYTTITAVHNTYCGTWYKNIWVGWRLSCLPLNYLICLALNISVLEG